MKNKINKYSILVIRSFYGSRKTKTLKTTEDGSSFVEFPNAESVRQEIKKLNSSIYYLSHNESGRPDYKLVRIGSKNFKRAFKKTSGGVEFNYI